MVTVRMKKNPHWHLELGVKSAVLLVTSWDMCKPTGISESLRGRDRGGRRDDQRRKNGNSSTGQAQWALSIFI